MIEIFLGAFVGAPIGLLLAWAVDRALHRIGRHRPEPIPEAELLALEGITFTRAQIDALEAHEGEDHV